MGKKKQPSPAAKRTQVPVAKPSVHRSKRIQRGRVVMERIKERIAGIEKRRNPAGSLGQDRPITQVTRKKYEEEEISRFSAERKIDEAILRVDVQLAMLMAAIEDDADDELKDAVVSGRLPLTESALRDLHPLSFMSGARIVKQLQALRNDQI
jgi:hypothetical protein